MNNTNSDPLKFLAVLNVTIRPSILIIKFSIKNTSKLNSSPSTSLTYSEKSTVKLSSSSKLIANGTSGKSISGRSFTECTVNSNDSLSDKNLSLTVTVIKAEPCQFNDGFKVKSPSWISASTPDVSLSTVKVKSVPGSGSVANNSMDRGTSSSVSWEPMYDNSGGSFSPNISIETSDGSEYNSPSKAR